MHRYTLRPRDASLHLIEVRIDTTSDGSALDFRMPAWRPGRYQMTPFAGRVQQFECDGGTWSRFDKDTWRVQPAAPGPLSVRYVVYAGLLDAGNSRCDHEELYVNPVNVCMAVGAALDERCLLRVDVPVHWKLAMPLAKGADGWFEAAGFHQLADTPFIASPTLDSFDFAVCEGLRCHVHMQGRGNYERSRLEHDLAKILAEQVALMGSTPPCGDFHFLYHLTPHKFSHGVEHANNTSIAVGPGDEFDVPASYDRFLGVSSHEFFHCWNVKRFRPQPLVPYDYWREHCTPLLYVVEGFTSYYGDLTLARTELWTQSRYFEALSEEINTLRGAPGHLVTSAEASSWNVWSAGYGGAAPTSALSFYNKGEVVGWMLDFEIRRRSEGARSLDDVMRWLDRHGSAYTLSDFEGAAAEAAGQSLDAFFERCARAADGLPLEDMLSESGLVLEDVVEKDKPEARLGAWLSESLVVQKLWPDGPAAAGGVEPGDALLAVNGRKASAASLGRLLEKAAPQDKLRLHVFRQEQLRDLELTLSEGCVRKYKLKPREPMTPGQRRALDAWLAPAARV